MRNKKDSESKKTKRILSLIMAVVLISSINMNVFAEEAILDKVTSTDTLSDDIDVVPDSEGIDNNNPAIPDSESPIGSSAVITDSDEFPEGMTEEEKQQMINEIYEDIGADKDYDPNDEDRLTVEDIENGLKEADTDSISNEEIEEMLEKVMPSDEEIVDMSESLGNQVMNVAKYRTGYDKSGNMYRYYYSSGDGFSISVPIGGWSNYAVAIKVDENVQLLNILRDGIVLSDIPGEDGAYFFREYGKYEFQVAGIDKGKTAIIPGTFRIVSPTERVSESFIWTPEGYTLSGIRCDGNKAPALDTRFVSLVKDGTYEIDYKPVADLNNKLPNYSIYFVRDTTPPIIRFDGDIQKGHFSGNVTYSVVEPDTEVKIYYNGQQAVSENHVLAAAGDYYITATDPSGNTREYSFIILRKGHVPWQLITVFFCVLILMSLFVVLTSKKYMRIK